MVTETTLDDYIKILGEIKTEAEDVLVLSKKLDKETEILNSKFDKIKNEISKVKHLLRFEFIPKFERDDYSNNSAEYFEEDGKKIKGILIHRDGSESTLCGYVYYLMEDLSVSLYLKDWNKSGGMFTYELEKIRDNVPFGFEIRSHTEKDIISSFGLSEYLEGVRNELSAVKYIKELYLQYNSWEMKSVDRILSIL